MIDRYMMSRLIDLWLAEDIGSGDLTSQTMIDADACATFAMNARQPMIVAGAAVAAARERADGHGGLAVQRQPQGLGPLRRRRLMHLPDVGEDGIGLLDLFLGLHFCTLVRR